MVFRAKHVLTGRHKEIIAMILDGGATNKEISESLHITEGTVKTHVYNIFRKTEVTSRNQLLSNILGKLSLTLLP